MKCECGSDALGSPNHSDYCPKHPAYGLVESEPEKPVVTLPKGSVQKFHLVFPIDKTIELYDNIFKQYFMNRHRKLVRYEMHISAKNFNALVHDHNLYSMVTDNNTLRLKGLANEYIEIIEALACDNDLLYWL